MHLNFPLFILNPQMLNGVRQPRLVDIALTLDGMVVKAMVKKLRSITNISL